MADRNVGGPIRPPNVRATVARKRATEGPCEPAEAEVEATIGSKGWYTRGYLPHYDKPGTLQMVTFRLADAMPAARRQEWEALLKIEDEREQRTKLEAYLDLGYGECVLRNPGAASAVEEVVLRFDGQRYRLTAWVAMPNHVHVLVEVWTMPMGKLLKAWKGASANAVNLVLGRTGTLWQREYWDRYMRDEAHFRKARHYIEWNPVKAHRRQPYFSCFRGKGIRSQGFPMLVGLGRLRAHGPPRAWIEVRRGWLPAGLTAPIIPTGRSPKSALALPTALALLNLYAYKLTDNQAYETPLIRPLPPARLPHLAAPQVRQAQLPLCPGETSYFASPVL